MISLRKKCQQYRTLQLTTYHQEDNNDLKITANNRKTWKATAFHYVSDLQKEEREQFLLWDILPQVTVREKCTVLFEHI